VSRALAEILDVLLVLVPAAIASTALGLEIVGRSLLNTAMALIYNALLDGGPAGQTLGKRILGIRVIGDEDGEPIGYGRGATRAAVPIGIGVVSQASLLLLPAALLNYLWPLWDQRRQTWHDKIARTVVVQVDRST
jgi:uncharacterized RDD family membrane protein YckC